MHPSPAQTFSRDRGGHLYHRLLYNDDVNLSIELDREDDGRWIAEALELPGVMAYGETREDADRKSTRLNSSH